MIAVFGLVVILSFNQDAVSRIFSYIAYNIFVKQFFLIQHEIDAYGQVVQVFLHFLIKILTGYKAGGILFRSYNELWRRHGYIYFVEFLDVFTLEVVVVGKGHWRDALCNRRQILQHLTWGSNTCQQQDVFIRELRKGDCALRLLENRVKCLILQSRKVQMLVGEQLHSLGDDAIFHGLQLFRTFRHDDDIGPVLAL